MSDPLKFLWPLVDAPEPVVAAHVVAVWPAGVQQWLVDLGLLREAALADRVLCPECHGHVEEVLASDGPGGSTRFMISCPEVLRAEVSPEALRQWLVDYATLVAALAESLGLTGQPAELVPTRLWRLGRTNWQGKSRDVLLARGLHWDDGAMVRATLVRARKPIVFVPLCRPHDAIWRTLPPLLVLSQVTMCSTAGLEIETLEVTAAIHDADAQSTNAIGSSLTREDLTLMIRRQVKAEGKTILTDDAYVAAYRQCGSVRGAAAFLSEHTGQEVTKDKVHNALKRSGGAAAVLNAKDSDSLVRGVASQRRDKRGKTLTQSQPLDTE